MWIKPHTERAEERKEKLVLSVKSFPDIFLTNNSDLSDNLLWLYNIKLGTTTIPGKFTKNRNEWRKRNPYRAALL